MNRQPPSIQSVLRRLSFRLAIAQFLEIWLPFAALALFVAGVVTLVCRIFFPLVAGYLPWLWLLPCLMMVPAAVICWMRAYRPQEILALADSFSGGKGLLLSVMETGDSRWSDSLSSVASEFSAPRMRFARRLLPMLAATAFFIGALWIPQRILTPNPGAQLLAQEMTQELKDAIVELQKKDLITQKEAKKLEEEIERLRQAAAQKFDASTWEAADTMRERLAASLQNKQDAVKWAQDSLRRFAQAAPNAPPNNEAGPTGVSNVEQAGEELAKALEKLAQSGMLKQLPEELQNMFGGQQAIESGTSLLPTDPQELQKLAQRLLEQLGQSRQALDYVAQQMKGGGKLDPSDFPLQTEEREGLYSTSDNEGFDPNPGLDGDGEPGRGGISRGRGDAAMTWGRESKPTDRFQPLQLPTNVPRNPDDWSPVAVIPSAPKVAPETSVAAPAQPMEETAGQAAWRRSLTPRHRSAVKNYFDSDKKP